MNPLSFNSILQNNTITNQELKKIAEQVLFSTNTINLDVVIELMKAAYQAGYTKGTQEKQSLSSALEKAKFPSAWDYDNNLKSLIDPTDFLKPS